MKTLLLNGNVIKQDNGSGYALSKAFKNKRFHNNVLYVVTYHGISLDNSTVVSIKRSRKQ